MHSDFDLTEIVLKHNVPTWSLRDHVRTSSSAHHAALQSKIVKLKDLGKTSIVAVSDSPTSQYRNAKNVFLMKTLAEELGVTIRLLFTESGHGKSPCDGVGGNIKTEVENALLKSHGEKDLRTIHSAKYVSKNLPSDVFYENVKIKESRRIQRVDDNVWYTIPHDHRAVSSINLILIPGIDLFGQYHVETLRKRS